MDNRPGSITLSEASPKYVEGRSYPRVHVHVVDPDSGPLWCIYSYEKGDDSSRVFNGYTACDLGRGAHPTQDGCGDWYGPWDPPASTATDFEEDTGYSGLEVAGPHTVVVEVVLSKDLANRYEGGPRCDPYTESFKAEFTIVVPSG